MLRCRFASGLIALLLLANTAHELIAPRAAAAAAAPAPKPILVGAWVKPRQPGPATVADLEKAIGRHLDYALHYQPLTGAFPDAAELDDKANHRVPMVSLGCGMVPDVASGAYDADIAKLAASMAAYGKPIELRYCWEMNGGYRHIDAGDFVPEWRHLHDLFTHAGVKNVRWFFCPGAEFGRTGRSGLAYYPGDAYVNDIGVDMYDRRGEGFQQMFDTVYHAFDGIAKPFIIGETGALGTQDQPTFLTPNTVSLLRSAYPKVVAVVYFDAAGPHGDWSFTPEGLAAFAAFAKAAH